MALAARLWLFTPSGTQSDLVGGLDGRVSSDLHRFGVDFVAVKFHGEVAFLPVEFRSGFQRFLLVPITTKICYCRKLFCLLELESLIYIISGYR